MTFYEDNGLPDPSSFTTCYCNTDLCNKEDYIVEWMYNGAVRNICKAVWLALGAQLLVYHSKTFM